MESERRRAISLILATILLTLVVFPSLSNSMHSYAVSDVSIMTSADALGGSFFGHGALQVIIKDSDADNDENDSMTVEIEAASDGTGRMDQLWHQNYPSIKGTAEVGDRFGSSLSTGDFNNNGYADLAIGVPGDDLQNNKITDTGMVNVIYGSASGISASRGLADQAWHQSTPDVEGVLGNGDDFGESMTR